MNRRRLAKLLILPVAGALAVGAWAATANSAPPDPDTGLFHIVASTTTVTVACPAPGAEGATVTPVEFSIAPGGGIGSAVVPVDQVDEVAGYFVSLGVLGAPQTIGVNGSVTVPAGTAITCPGDLPGDAGNEVLAIALTDQGFPLGGTASLVVRLSFLEGPS